MACFSYRCLFISVCWVAVLRAYSSFVCLCAGVFTVWIFIISARSGVEYDLKTGLKSSGALFLFLFGSLDDFVTIVTLR